MTKYKTKIQYVSYNDFVEGQNKKADIKKAKLENQGYNLISTQSSLNSALLVYEKPKRPTMTKEDWNKLSKALNTALTRSETRTERG